MKYKITLSYDGTEYNGWQVQPNGTTIQECVQNAASTYLREEIRIHGSGRTDAGVHAHGQIAHFNTEQEIEPYRFLAAMNGILPLDIRVMAIEAAPEEFHARYSAKGKIYHYHICTGPVQSPFKRLYSVHLRAPLNLEAMRKGASQFLGTHDFTSFANEPTAGAVAKNPIRTLQRLDLIETEGGIRLEFQANGFLYKMVRNMVGMLMEIGTEKRAPEEVSLILEAKNRRLSAKAAPARGLSLVKVIY